MRLKQRSRVDFPQPEGPMMAVIWSSGIPSVTPFKTWCVPYQSERFSASTAAFEGPEVESRGAFFPRSTPGMMEWPPLGPPDADLVRTPMMKLYGPEAGSGVTAMLQLCYEKAAGAGSSNQK